MVVNSKCKTKRKYTDNSIDKTQKGGFLGMGSPEYTSISQALDVLATVKNKYVYKLFLSWVNEKGIGLFEKVSDARSKLDRLEKFIASVNKKIISPESSNITLDLLNMKRKYLVRIILCMAYVYCKKSNLEEEHINNFAEDIKKVFDKSKTATMTNQERNNKIIDSIKKNLLIGVSNENLANYKMVIINLYQKLRKINLEKTKFEVISAEAQLKLFKEEQNQEARLALAKQALPATNNNATFQKQLDEIETLYRAINNDFTTSNNKLTALYTNISFDITKPVSPTNPTNPPDATQIKTLLDIIKTLSSILNNCNQLITKATSANASASASGSPKKEKFENLLKSIGYADLTDLTTYIGNGTSGLIENINKKLTIANALTRPILTGGKRSHRTKKHISSAKKHSRNHNNSNSNNNKNKNKKRKTKTTRNKTRKH
jgi:hypothetical protein